MIESILLWLAEKILNYLLGKAVFAVQEKAADLKEEMERGVTNDANVKAYNDAKTRQDRVKGALDLINRTKR